MGSGSSLRFSRIFGGHLGYYNVRTNCSLLGDISASSRSLQAFIFLRRFSPLSHIVYLNSLVPLCQRSFMWFL